MDQWWDHFGRSPVATAGRRDPSDERLKDEEGKRYDKRESKRIGRGSASFAKHTKAFEES